MRKLAVLFLCVLTFFSAVPAAYADDKGFFEEAWDSVSSYFSDDDHNDEDTVDNDDSAGDDGDSVTPTPTPTPDTIPPTVTPPANIITEATGALTAVVFGSATVTDNVDMGLAATGSPAGPFTVGVHTVTWRATDAAGNVGTARQTVTVTDTTVPAITVQQPAITVEATAAQMTANLGVVTATDLVDGTITPTSDAPATFPLGVTTVTYTATDAAGNAATAQQLVTVQDTTPPAITAPAAVTADSATGQPIAVNIGTAIATDAFTPVTVTNNAPATFPIGNTTVTWTATDANGNSATTTQLVTVNDASIFANLPPDPGAAGKATLAGIDSDNDGVRDDVQRWIVMNYPNSEKTRAALTQMAGSMQQFLLDAVDPVKSYSNASQQSKDGDCLAYVQPDNFYDIAMEFRAIFLNTDLRTKTWLQADRHLSGKGFTLLDNEKLGCNFDPDVMPN